MVKSEIRCDRRSLRWKPKFRFSICGLLILTLASAVSSRLYVAGQTYRMEANRNQELARHWTKLASLVHSPDSIEMSAFHFSLAAKYERLAAYPWLPAGDDPLPPRQDDKDATRIQLASQSR